MFSLTPFILSSIIGVAVTQYGPSSPFGYNYYPSYTGYFSRYEAYDGYEDFDDFDGPYHHHHTQFCRRINTTVEESEYVSRTSVKYFVYKHEEYALLSCKHREGKNATVLLVSPEYHPSAESYEEITFGSTSQTLIKCGRHGKFVANEKEKENRIHVLNAACLQGNAAFV